MGAHLKDRVHQSRARTVDRVRVTREARVAKAKAKVNREARVIKARPKVDKEVKANKARVDRARMAKVKLVAKPKMVDRVRRVVKDRQATRVKHKETVSNLRMDSNSHQLSITRMVPRMAREELQATKRVAEDPQATTQAMVPDQDRNELINLIRYYA